MQRTGYTLPDLLGALDEAKVATAQARVIDQIRSASASNQLLLVGSGHLGRKVAAAAAAAGSPASAFIEYDPRFWGGEVDGLPVLSGDEAYRRFSGKALCVSTVWSPNHVYDVTRRLLAGFGFERALPVNAMFWAFSDRIGPHYQLGPPTEYSPHAQAVERLWSLLSDPVSRDQFAGALLWRLTLDPGHLPIPERRTLYFDPQIVRLDGDASLVDCGGYDGDTLRAFLYWQGKAFKEAIVFEPDPISFARLQTFAAGLPDGLPERVECRRQAVGSEAGVIRFTATGTPGTLVEGAGDVEMPVVVLDDELAGRQVTYLKFDVEGAEAQALAGVSKTLERCRPVVGLSVYHKPTDLFLLPLDIAQRSPGYRHHFRAHDYDGIDFIYYGVPEKYAGLGEP